MSDSDNASSGYFLGIEGEQSGPFTEEEVAAKVAAGQIPKDALAWREGMAEWQPVESISAFRSKPAAAAPAAPATPPAPKPAPASVAGLKFAPLSEDAGSLTSPSIPNPAAAKAAKEEEELAPVFSSEDAVFSATPFVQNRIAMVSLGVGVIAIVGGAYFYFTAQSNPIAQVQVPKKMEKAENYRQIELNRALSQLMLEPKASIQVLSALAKTNSEDAVGKEAITSLVDYYKRQMTPAEAANFLLEIKKPEEAAKLFLEDSSTVQQAAEAYYTAFTTSQSPERKKYLLENVRLLLHPIKNINLAINRIREFEKNFPGQAHPYGYYLRTNDEKIADLFQRISFHFVQSLLSYLNTELPQIGFSDRPLVEVRKTRTGEYRIVGSYRGEVTFNRDRLNNIYFVFWLVNDAWKIVDTNLTIERRKFASVERKKYEPRAVPANTMLAFMERVFTSQFPKNALHESVAPKAPTRPTRLE
jgi:hypothetical protein